MATRRIYAYFLLIPILALANVTAGCGSVPADEHSAATMASLHSMPAEVQSAPERVQQAYQFAVANHEVLSQIPCYCGCGGLGHASNLACYVQPAGTEADPVFDLHAVNCAICVDITQDTMRLLRRGKSVAEIKDYVDTTYARFGPSNMP